MYKHYSILIKLFACCCLTLIIPGCKDGNNPDPNPNPVNEQGCNGGQFGIGPVGSVCVCPPGTYRQNDPVNGGEVNCGTSPYQGACGNLTAASFQLENDELVKMKNALSDCYGCINSKCPYQGDGGMPGTYPPGCDPSDPNNNENVQDCENQYNPD